MRPTLYALPLALLVPTVALADVEVSCTIAGKAKWITATQRGDTYAVNGSAIEAAGAFGWKDAKKHFDPPQVRALLERGLEVCVDQDRVKKVDVDSLKATIPSKAESLSLASDAPLDPAVFSKAAAKGDINTLKNFISRGFKVNTPGPGVPALGIKGSPAINEAAAAGQCQALDYLLSVGAVADPKGIKTGFTPVGNAAQAGAAECLRSLLAKGARVDVRDEPGGDTPLIKAAYQGHLEAVIVLVDGGANLTLKNRDGDTPYRAAVVMGNNSVARYLKGKGGK